MRPRFSIIIPVFGVAPYLRECLDSILGQTVRDWEAICVDDGSTDGSADILDEYQASDARIRVIHKVNSGVADSRNVGMTKARGDYITFVDSDDVILPDWLERASDILGKEAPDLLRMLPTRWEIGDNRSSLIVPCRLGYIRCADEEVPRWGWNVLLRSGWCWVLFIRRDVLDATTIFPLGMRMKEDNIFCLRLMKRVHSVVQGEYAGYLYRQRKSSISRVYRPVEDSVRFMNELLYEWDFFMRQDHNPEFVSFVRRLVTRYYWRDVELFLYSRVIPDLRSVHTISQMCRKARRHGLLRFKDCPREFRVKVGAVIVLKSAWGVLAVRYASAVARRAMRVLGGARRHKQKGVLICR